MSTFRKIVRAKQALTDSACREILTHSLRGVLALTGEDGYPYALPMNHYYDAERNKIYFHSGKTGYKVECIEHSDKACFTTQDEGVRNQGEWWLTIRSVVVFGRMEMITDPEEIKSVSRALSHKFTQDESYIDEEIAKYAPATLLLALRIEDMQGKAVKEK